MLISEDRLNTIVSHIAENNGLKSWRYICNDVENNIQNYFGVLIPVTVIGTIEDREITLNIFLKVPPADIAPRLKPVFKYLFETEAFYYGKIMPLYKNVSKFGKIEEFIPECYFIDTKEEKRVLALKNMIFEGFQRYKKDTFLDFDHVVVALRSLANFHAFYTVLEKKGQVRKYELLRPYTNVYPLELNVTLKLALINHTKYFDTSKYRHFLQSLLENFDQIRMNSSEKVKLLVFGHGDYWKENMLFKYKNGKPISACILDFQMCHLLSPAQDFLTFLLSSYSAPSRLQNFDCLLSLYLEQFNNVLIENNIDHIIYEENFKHDLKVVAEDSVVTTFMAFALWLGLENDALLNSKEENIKIDSSIQFKEIISNILDDLNTLGYIAV